MPSPKRLYASLLFLLSPLAFGGCGGSPNKLSGSLSQIYNLDFDSVQVSMIQSFLVVEYDKAGSQGKTLKMTVDLTGYTVVPSLEINLAEKAPSGSVRGTLQQIVSTMTDFTMTSGGLTLDAVPTVGQHLGGHFHATFSTPMGRSLDGDFSVDKVIQP